VSTSLVLREPAAAALFFGSLAAWGAFECSLVLRDFRAGLRRPPASDRNSGLLGVSMGGAGLIGSIVVAFIGAVILIVIVRLVTGSGRRTV